MRNTLVTYGVMVFGVAFALLGIGCDTGDREPDRQVPGDPLYEMWNSQGDRVVIRDGSGDAAYKVRLRSNGLKVYDRKFRALGYVDFPIDYTATPMSGENTDDTGGAVETDAGASTNEEGGEIHVRRLGGGDTERLKRVDTDVWALSDRLRIERTAKGWAVFDGDAQWIGRFSRGEQGDWRLEHREGGSGEWRIGDEDGELRVHRDGKTRFRTDASELPSEVLLALVLGEVSLLDRMAVAGWLRTRSESAGGAGE